MQSLSGTSQMWAAVT